MKPLYGKPRITGGMDIESTESGIRKGRGMPGYAEVQLPSHLAVSAPSGAKSGQSNRSPSAMSRGLFGNM